MIRWIYTLIRLRRTINNKLSLKGFMQKIWKRYNCRNRNQKSLNNYRN